MSVIGTYARVDAADLDGLRTNPHWLQALRENKVASAEVIDVDKAWHGITWLLSRCRAAPETRAAGAGFQIVRSPGGLLSGDGATKEPSLQAPYGPAKSLSVDQVATLSQWLTGVSADALRAAFDGPAMDEADVYPQMWAEEGSPAFEEYLLPYFDLLKAFLARATEAKQQVLVFFT